MSSRLRDEDGMTLIEVMAAMVVLIIGVLGTLTLIQGSLSSTSRTTAREQATNLARDVVERTRQSAYADMNYADAPGKIRAMMPAADSVTALSGSSFDVTRRRVTYHVTVFACSIDDPSDGAGQGDATFCAPPNVTNVPGSPTPGLAASVNVLGITVTAGGSALQTVCNALGISAIGSQLTSILNPIAPLSVCPTAPGSGTVQFDNRPDDLRRVRVDVTWTASSGGSLSQTTLLTNPRQNS